VKNPLEDFDYLGVELRDTLFRIGASYRAAAPALVCVLWFPTEEESESGERCGCAVEYVPREKALDLAMARRNARNARASDFAASALADPHRPRPGKIDVLALERDASDPTSEMPEVREVKLAEAMEESHAYLRRYAPVIFAALRGVMWRTFLPDGAVPRPCLRSVSCKVCVEWTKAMGAADLLALTAPAAAPGWEEARSDTGKLCALCAADLRALEAHLALDGFDIAAMGAEVGRAAADIDGFVRWYREAYGTRENHPIGEAHAMERVETMTVLAGLVRSAGGQA
jgi:hypothetical protein